MKTRFLIAALVSASPVLALDAASLPPMPTPYPAPPAGVNTATYPVPRLDWVDKFYGNLQHSRPIASSIRLIFDGDSITDWWPARAPEIWNAHYGKLNAFDFAIAGDRTEHLLYRLAEGQVKGMHPKLVALMIGTNNLGSNTSEQIAEGVKAIVEDYRKRCPDAVILLQGIFPRGASPADPARAKIKEINTIISKLADGQKVIYVDFGDKFLQPDGSLSPEIMPDYLHPSPKGYQIWADAIQPVIDKYFPPQK